MSLNITQKPLKSEYKYFLFNKIYKSNEKLKK